MSDSIIVRVMLGSYDVVHPTERQTQVYVQIPEVARAIWLLDEEMYSVLKDLPWPKVVASAEECYVQRRLVSDSVSASSRAAVVKWLRDDTNHDLMYEAWEQDQARQNPVARRLLDENERLREQLRLEQLVSERLWDALASAKRGRRLARAKVAELLTERHTTNTALSEAAETLRENRDRFETLRALCDAAEQVGIVSGGWFTVEAVRRAAAGESLPQVGGEE